MKFGQSTFFRSGAWYKLSATKSCAGLTHPHFHDLRGTAITVLAENECTNAQIASITGHSMKHIEKIIDTYMA